MDVSWTCDGRVSAFCLIFGAAADRRVVDPHAIATAWRSRAVRSSCLYRRLSESARSGVAGAWAPGGLVAMTSLGTSFGPSLGTSRL